MREESGTGHGGEGDVKSTGRLNRLSSGRDRQYFQMKSFFASSKHTSAQLETVGMNSFGHSKQMDMPY